uniref:Heat shock transcription factor 2 n=1 Tax=Nothobranchius furzeri TaxID=105023 RepID=A0A8C6KQ41_NOTFU
MPGSGAGSARGPSTNSNVPAFLSKLWTLVEDADTNEFICWSQEGSSFLVLDEQRFAKEILPKFFKHNNMASFVRQLNMYGFRKVMHIDTGIVKQERDGPVEFQHPYFKHGQDDLLENIKRKVSNTRPEDNKFRHGDLTKILASVQNIHSKQESIDVRLASLKRENEALWREISDLRQKHSHQQQLIKKVCNRCIGIVRHNRLWWNVVLFLMAAPAYIQICQSERPPHLPSGSALMWYCRAERLSCNLRPNRNRISPTGSVGFGP